MQPSSPTSLIQVLHLYVLFSFFYEIMYFRQMSIAIFEMM